jgi:hypothetical protein
MNVATYHMLTSLGFTEEEIQVIEQLASDQNLDAYQVLRQALRQYQMVASGVSKLETIVPASMSAPVLNPVSGGF